MQHEIAADRLAADALKAGEAVWSAVELACENGLSWKYARRTFDCLVEQLVDDMRDHERQLFSASMYEAIPMVRLSEVERAEINNNAWTAYDYYVETASREALFDSADLAYDAARDARLMGAA